MCLFGGLFTPELLELLQRAAMSLVNDIHYSAPEATPLTNPPKRGPAGYIRNKGLRVLYGWRRQRAPQERTFNFDQLIFGKLRLHIASLA